MFNIAIPNDTPYSRVFMYDQRAYLDITPTGIAETHMIAVGLTKMGRSLLRSKDGKVTNITQGDGGADYQLFQYMQYGADHKQSGFCPKKAAPCDQRKMPFGTWLLEVYAFPTTIDPRSIQRLRIEFSVESVEEAGKFGPMFVGESEDDESLTASCCKYSRQMCQKCANSRRSLHDDADTMDEDADRRLFSKELVSRGGAGECEG